MRKLLSKDLQVMDLAFTLARDHECQFIIVFNMGKPGRYAMWYSVLKKGTTISE